MCNDTERIQHDVRQFGLPPSTGSHPINSGTAAAVTAAAGTPIDAAAVAAATAALVVTTATGSDTLPASDEVEHQIAGAEQAAAM